MSTDDLIEEAPKRGRRSLAQQTGDTTKVRADSSVAEIIGNALEIDSEDDGRTLTHGFHAWPARMHPTTARRLIAAVPEGGLILDPFMGSGTVAVETLVSGRPFVGRDVNPVALEVAWTRTRHWDADRRERLLRVAREVSQAARELREAQPRVPEQVWEQEGEWYDPPALHEVWSLAVSIRDKRGSEQERRALRACLSSVIVKASKQASDSVPRLDRDHRFIPRRRVDGWFLARVRELADRLGHVTRGTAREHHEPDLGLLDARLDPHGLERCVQSIITSPPYPGVYDYFAHHQRRYGALGLDTDLAQRYEIGARRAVKTHGWRDASRQFQRDMATVMKVWRKVLVPGGRAYVVIGDGQHPSGVIRVLPLMKEAVESSGLQWLGQAAQDRQTWSVGGRTPKEKRHEYIVALERV